ncbi:AraC family transcriptional regulator [Paenibacillus thalictri]|uniref:AraC family transcriptional regulator n=1 Tax=Paenibacillus thalictri TaxID=2527873 RepID=A0A4V2J3T9_9BACL|nr:AraC family transcriptional regulator [Paenibacillus thalictri]TBL75614.1 AraC family transcriptional regulator [Paenibacillus thalictri]
MNSDILMCSYSYHTQRFVSAYPGGVHTYLFRLQAEGGAMALVDGKMVPVGPGDLLLFKPGMPYRLVVDEYESAPFGPVVGSGDYYLFCKGPWLDEWWNRSPKPVLTRIDLDDKLLALWKMIILEKRRFEESSSEMADYLLRSLCLMLDRAIVPAEPVKGKPFVATRMKSFIEEHAAVSFKIEDVARHVNLSVSRAAHLFKECYGKSMMEFTLEVRTAIALERMKYSTMTLQQIAETCGFGSYSYFHRVFKTQQGMSPTEYRELHTDMGTPRIK